MTAILLQAADAPMIEIGGINILGLALLAGLVGATVAFTYRSVTIYPVTSPVAILFGVSLPAVWLLVGSFGTGTELAGKPLTFYGTSLYFLGVFVGGGAIAEIGRRVGDYLVCELYEIERVPVTDPAVDAVRSASLTAAITLPETIDDVAGYEPADEQTKAALEGRTIRLPHGLSTEVCRERITSRLERDFDVDFVTIEFADEGTVETLAIGTESGTISPALPPGRVAVTIETDARPDANTGDIVEVWTTEQGSTRLVGIGRFWSSVDGTTTITVTADDADAFDTDGTYRLLTRRGLPSDGNELNSVIDRARETMASISVAANGPFDGEFVGWIPGTIVVIERDGESLPFPAERTTIQAGDTVYVLGTPGQLQQLDDYAPKNDHDSSKRSVAHD